MRVAYDAAPLLDPPTGIGRYTRELVHPLERLGVALVPYAVAFGAGRGATDAPEQLKRWRVPAKAAQKVWKLFERPAITHLTGKVDVVHATNFVLPPTGSARGVVTVHDLSFLRHDTFPGGERLRDLVPWSIRRAAKVLVPTEQIGSEVAETYALRPDKIAVTYEGVAERFFGATPLADTVLGRMGIPGPFILAVGTLEPRKNLPRLLQVWERIRDDLPEWSLVLAGPRGWGQELPRTEGVILTGWIGDETLPGLVAAAEIFCYPSFYEGFGLPPLEAMAAGTPSIVGDYSCAFEVLGDAALRIDPEDADAWESAIVSLAADPVGRKAMQVAGRARATRFTWERTAQATLQAYEDVIDG